MDKQVKVLVVDDSALMRKYLMQLLESDPSIKVVGTAINGSFALSKIQALKPDIITLDIEMPQMNGLEFLQEKAKKGIKTPVIVISSLTSTGSAITMKALDYGAKDYILKPSEISIENLADIRDEITIKIKSWARLSRYEYDVSAEPKKNIITSVKTIATSRFELLENPVSFLAIGISTGGPDALRKLLPFLITTIPIIIVQHMPEGFTKDFAESLNKYLNVYRAKEAVHNDIVRPGYIYIAPGNKQMALIEKNNSLNIQINDDPHVNNHRPSVDYLFSTLYNNVKSVKYIPIIMTGMGKDGAYYIKKIHEKNIFTIAQDEDSCVVYGMPKVAAESGGIDFISDINGIIELLNTKIKENVIQRA